MSLTTPYNRALHRFATFTAFATFILLIVGALVTSNDAGLSVPDWPTSFGSMYRIPPMVGGVKFEHGHRMFAQFIGLLTIVLAVWTQKADRRRWMRVLGWTALGTVIAQGVVGGLTVLFYLPPAVSTAHATLAQTFFCIVVAMALFTGRKWVEQEPRTTVHHESPSLPTLTSVAAGAVYLQLILGAAFRHSGIKLLPHIIGACIVSILLIWTIIRVLTRYAEHPQLRRPAIMLLGLLVLQLSLGFMAYMTRVILQPDAPQPLVLMVWSTVTHVVCGALVLATSVVLAIQSRRYIAVPAEALKPVPHTQRPLTA